VSALAAADLVALRDAVGDGAVDAGGCEADDAKLAVAVFPGDEAALARAVSTAALRGIGCVVQGGGSRASFGNPSRGARALLSTARLSGVIELDAGEGVMQARAGTPLAALREAAREAGWELPLDPPGARATLGGTLASGAVGPRHLGYGRPRDLVLGLEVVLGDGVRTRCGGRVVKNVTGYDLMKLQVGASGALGVIASAWLRLRPRPESERVLSAALEPEALGRAVAAARVSTARACVIVDESFAAVVEPRRAPASGWTLVVECAGDEAAVAADAARLTSELGAVAASPGALARARGLQGETFGPVGMRFRLAALPSRLDAVSGELRRAGAAVLAQPGSGLVYARMALDEEAGGAGVDRAWMAARSAARAGGGHAVLEAAPAWARAARDVFGDDSDAWRIARALKARFDPAGVLNPGRWVGAL
jgi:glycolate oxidase FAD binding subunit